ncbi:MAG: alpha/beta hydrolase [Bacteroidetes bacterium]|nr:alpha/beta hydrolase [Bacteroidota bacterium]
MIDFTDKIYSGADGRQSLYDCVIPPEPHAVVIFIHGYKGYKDWGCWNLLQNKFVQHKFGFIKFNLSHNGGTVQQKIDFPDLEAFGRNTYSKELYDVGVITGEAHRLIVQELELNIPIYLLGHSRGGGDAVLYASRDERIRKVVSLAGISDIGSRFPTGKELDYWREEGVRFVENTRTQQMMPHYFDMYEDFKLNEDQLNIETAARSLTIPFLQIHGDMDTSVSIREGYELADWTATELKITKGADHTFGSAQPWTSAEMPEDLDFAADAALEFFSQGIV